jgi:hypothetical protein
MTARIGVFADATRWRVAQSDWQAAFESRAEALEEALRQASLARWRGETVEILFQSSPGEALAPVELEPPPPP